jgi:hypothetical protein
MNGNARHHFTRETAARHEPIKIVAVPSGVPEDVRDDGADHSQGDD